VLLAFGTTFAVDPPDPPDPPDRPERVHHGDSEPKVAIFGDVTVEKGETKQGIVCVRGNVTIDGEVDGDVVVVAGKLDIEGTVRGSIVAVATPIDLGDHAVVDGDLTNVGGSVDKGEAEVHGSVVNVSPMGLNLPGFGNWGSWGGLGAAWLFPWWTILGLFLFFVAALVLAALVPDRIRLMSEETPVRLFTAFLFGLLGYMLLALTQTVLCVTLIGIPIAILVYFVFVILKWMAMCGIFHYVGTRLARSFGRETSFLGAILLGLVPFGLIRLIPTCCFGWTVWFMVEITAFGLLIITRLGTRTMGPVPVPAAAVIVPPAAPAPPPPM
jgi:hypothetical protein